MNDDETAVPEGMVVVTEDEFFRLLQDDGRDIMPSTENPHNTLWRETRTRELWGWSIPGWRNPGRPKVWAVVEPGAVD